MGASHYAKSIRFDTQLLTIRGHGQAMNLLYRKLGGIHKSETMKKHFESIPETRATVGGYNYEKRSRRWRKRKRREKGHNKPLVFSGDLQKLVISSSDITATQRKFTFKARSPFPLKEKRREELEVISRREIREYSRWLEREYPIEASKSKHQRITKKRIRS